MEKRHYFLGAALLATIIASVDWGSEATLDIAEPVVKDKMTAAIKSKEEAKIVPTNMQWVLEKEAPDLFALAPRVVIAPKPLIRKPAIVMAMPKPKPTAPALPFVYIGKMLVEGKATVYVSKAGRNYALTGGEVIDGVYNVIHVDQHKVTFQYVPLKIEQELIIRGTN